MKGAERRAKIRARRYAFHRQQRIDRFACAALTGMLAAGTDHALGERLWGSDAIAATWAYDTAEAMEAERARRLAGGVDGGGVAPVGTVESSTAPVPTTGEAAK